MFTPIDLKCEYLDGDVLTDETRPRFNWQLAGGPRNATQSHYEILVSAEAEAEGEGEPIWSSGKVQSSATTQIEYEGPEPSPLQRMTWQVRVWAVGSDTPSEWSYRASWQAGFLANEHWSAQWISGLVRLPMAPPSGDVAYDMSMMNPVMHLRKNFNARGALRRATIYATARGVYRLSFNGARVGDDELSPGWTDYRRRLHYRKYDVTAEVKEGSNTLGAQLGEGWYSGYVGFNGKHPAAHYGDTPQLLAELHLEYDDGTIDVIASDQSWKGAPGPRKWSDLLRGELYLGFDELTGWDQPEFDDSKWDQAIAVGEIGEARLLAAPSPPIRVTVEHAPSRVWKNSAGNWMVKFDQYFSGVVQLTLDGPPGTAIRIKHGEWIKDDRAYMENLWSAKPIDVVILKGGRQTYRPLFTQHAFQYVEIEGLEDLAIGDVVGLQFHTDNSRTGRFECSEPALTRLADNVDWTLRSNSMSVPTCEPARDERMAYLGDTQIAAATAFFTRDHSAFYTKWTDDILDATEDLGGLFSNSAPTPHPEEAAPGWGDGGIILPWTMYRFYGDTRVIRKMWSAMELWMRTIEEANPGHLRTERLNSNFNDWLVPGDADVTPSAVVATAWWYWCSRLMAQMASVVGFEDDSSRYDELSRKIATAFVSEFMDEAGRISGDTQTAYSMAFRFGIVPSELRESAAQRFRESIEREGSTIRVGFAGVGFILPALEEAGLTDVAYDLLLQRSYPSWLYPVNAGATTIWERWNTVTETGEFPTVNMNAFSLVALGAGVEWLYSGVAGIRGNHGSLVGDFEIAPQIDSRLSWARASFDTPSGTLKSEWRISDDHIHYNFEIPSNSRAKLVIDGVDDDVELPVLIGGAEWEIKGGNASTLVGAGISSFAIPLSPRPREC